MPSTHQDPSIPCGSSDDAAAAVVQVALGEPVNRIVEVAGPARERLGTLVMRMTEARGDRRHVVVDAAARYFGAVVREDTLVPKS